MGRMRAVTAKVFKERLLAPPVYLSGCLPLLKGEAVPSSATGPFSFAPLLSPLPDGLTSTRRLCGRGRPRAGWGGSITHRPEGTDAKVDLSQYTGLCCLPSASGKPDKPTSRPGQRPAKVVYTDRRSP
jgi:hypothetical protein